MLLAIDIGNSTTVFGLFDGKKLKKRWGEETSNLSLDKLGTVPASIHVIVSSVVPKANKIIKKKFPQAHFVTASNIKGIKIKAKKSEVGADRVVNALAAYKMYGGPAIVVDFGTATTFDVISSKGEYLGGAIAPGLALQADILHKATAKLPRLKIKDTKKLIGKTTKEAILSGLVYGYVSLVEGMVERMIETCHGMSIRNTTVIATGGFAKMIAKHSDIIDIVDQDITLNGLKLAWRIING
ncbi:MAG: type III pantothenate kinase [Candidatus Saganbacteria bacterium]|nr:type III pantothenate kinase [Candidatus Saganbacteria bacterium]